MDNVNPNRPTRGVLQPEGEEALEPANLERPKVVHNESTSGQAVLLGYPEQLQCVCTKREPQRFSAVLP
ncbi:hypothetical protein [Sorangium sp. So ce131]|uniref:hypothetical protein n=1 Tax=Sorangium sp. So ce131 TaxID=3133282 RepID=UPI003F63BE5C